VRSSLRARARSLTPRLLVSSVWSLPSACSTSVTASRSSAASRRRSRRRRYVSSLLSYEVLQKPRLTKIQAEYAQILAKRVAEAKAQKADLRKRRASSLRK